MYGNYSISQRTLLATTIALVCFLGIVGWVLDLAFRDSAAQGVRQNLESTLYGLMAVADVNQDRQLTVPNFLADERLNRPGSGLYALISDQHNNPSWRSRSWLGESPPATVPLPVGQREFQSTVKPGKFFIYSAGIAWEINETQAVDYTFHILTSPAIYQAQVQQFRKSLWGWLGTITILLLAIQIALLRWSLSPLRRVAEDLLQVEDGKREQLTGIYPVELQGLTHNLNHLLLTRQHQITRYRNSLADLAHSLKTPLAVLRGLDNTDDSGSQQTLREQTDRMTRIVDYQLQRAATAGKAGIARRTQLRPTLQRLIDSLSKVYDAKNIICELNIPDHIELDIDENDLMELAGNLLDNAFKWADSHVHASAYQQEGDTTIVIEDDGQGIDTKSRAHVLKRGSRADMSNNGHGIGLAICVDIVNAYQASIDIQQSDMGGSKIIIIFP